MSDWVSEGALRWGCILVGLCSVGTGVVRLHLRLLLFRSRGLIAQDNLSDALAADAETIDAVMQRRDIQPRLILNGQRFYKRSDFGDMPRLLRPSQAPPGIEGTLLRPMAGVGDAEAVTLLRPAVEEATEATAYVSLPKISEG